MRKRLLLAAAGTLISGVGLVAAVAPADASPHSPVVGHVYVNDNAAHANTVAGFDRHADGSLTPLPGSPFAAGGAGLGSGLGSQGAIQTSPDGRYLLTVDAGSNQISVLRVQSNGVPVPVGSPVASGGVEPVSVTISRQGVVYVANVGNGGSNYSGFFLTPWGELLRLPNSTVPVPEGSAVGDVFFNSTGDRLVGTRDATSLIDSFVVRSDGRLAAAPGSPFKAQSLGPIGSEFSPTNPSQLYVSNAHAGAGKGTVSAYQVGSRGVLTPIGDSPFADHQTAACWVEISHNGKYLFAVNTASGNVSRYSIGSHGGLHLIGTTPMRNGAGAVDVRLSPDGRTLFVTGSAAHVVSSFSVRGGSLTELPGSPTALPAGTSPTGLVVL